MAGRTPSAGPSASYINGGGHFTATLKDYQGIVDIDGGGGDGTYNTLRGPDTDHDWDIYGNDRGVAFSPPFSTADKWVNFKNIGNLTGGTGKNRFLLYDGMGVSGKIDGGAGVGNLLQYGYSTGVYVNLQLGIATNVLGGITRIQNVVAGGGNNILVGDGNGNDLEAGGGRNLIIGGTLGVLSGKSETLSGTDCILIAGYTDYDLNTAALQAILAEWVRTDLDYAHRADHIQNGDEPGDPYRLDATTVHYNQAIAGNTLNGGIYPGEESVLRRFLERQPPHHRYSPRYMGRYHLGLQRIIPQWVDHLAQPAPQGRRIRLVVVVRVCFPSPIIVPAGRRVAASAGGTSPKWRHRGRAYRRTRRVPNR
jgi:hypothetical protein